MDQIKKGFVKKTLKLKSFTEEQTAILSENFTLHKQLDEGDFFLQEGQVCRHLTLITAGLFRYFYHTEQGEVTRWISFEGDFMTSLASFIKEKPAVENIQAIKPAELWMMPKTVWVNLYEKHPFLQRFWLKTIEYNYIGMEERVFHQIALSAEQRYQWMLENYPRFNKEVPAKYIASMLGITPRHLSRIRAKRG